MTNRRQFLTGLPVAAAVGFSTTAGSSAERAAAEKSAAQKAAEIRAIAATRGPNDAAVLCTPVDSGGVIDISQRDAFPNVMMVNQDGLGMSFYEGFIENKIVMMHFMSIRDEEHFPITHFVRDVVAELGSKVGREVQVYSITRDPVHDTPERLAEFAKDIGARKGWQFLTGSQGHCSDLAFRMYRMGHSTLPGKRKVDVVFYGNGSVGLWGAFPYGIQPDDAASRISWVMPQAMPADGKMRRAGPRVFNMSDTQNHNREV